MAVAEEGMRDRETSRGGLNLHIFPSPLNYYARVSKIGRSLVKNGVFSRVEVVGRKEEGLSEVEVLYENLLIKRVAVWNPRFRQRFVVRLILFLEWYAKVFWMYRKRPVACLNCRTLAALPLGIVLKIIHRCPLVYDAHELETETYMMTGLRRTVARALERLCIGWVDFGIFVCDSISEWYRRELNLKETFTIRNVPYLNESRGPSRSSILRDRFGIEDSAVVVIYQGLIAKGRGLELMLEEFGGLRENVHFVMLGKGVLVDFVQEYVRKYRNIHYVDHVPHSELLNYTQGADVGIHMIENCCLNHYYCLPNKIFEYFMAGLPVIVSNVPEMRNVVEEYEAGWAIDETKGALRKLLSQLTANKIENARQGAMRARSKCNWEEEERRLLDIYESKGFPVSGDSEVQLNIGSRSD
jgi:glycosyltransferase involved in cell wall biosynthesis